MYQPRYYITLRVWRELGSATGAAKLYLVHLCVRKQFGLSHEKA